MARRLPSLYAALPTIALLAGCATYPASRLPDPKIGVPSASSTLGNPRGSDGSAVDAPPVTQVRIPASSLTMRAIEVGERFPIHEVGPLNLTGVDAATALGMIAETAGVAVVSDEEAGKRQVRISIPGKVTLARAVDMVCENARLHCVYRGGALHLTGTRRFAVDLPPVPGLGEAVEASLIATGATDVNVDDKAHIVSFSADRPAARDAQRYLAEVGTRTPLLVYDIWVLEVGLTAENSTGIQWKQLAATLGDVNITSAGGAAAASGAFTLGVATKGTAAAIDLVLGFLSTQGEVSSLARPSIAVLSGREGTYTVGEEIKYVSRLTSLPGGGVTQFQTQPTTGTTTTAPAGTTAAATGTVPTTTGLAGIPASLLGSLGLGGYGTGSSSYSSSPALAGTDVQTLKTGLDMKIEGVMSEGTVHTDIKLSITNLLRWHEYPSGLITIRLPETSVRKAETSVRVRPGDMLMMTGMLSASSDANNQRILDQVPTSRSRTERRSEVVTIVRPRVIQFVR